jgi:pyruvate/2-oxoglutarate dehydrogenase complex dihydrolipoamide dehydrogenase (E3) component
MRKDILSSLAVIVAEVIGSEYATIIAIFGVRVMLVYRRPNLLSLVDSKITDALVYQLRQNRATMRLGEEISGTKPFKDERGEHVRIKLESGTQIISQKALYSVGRVGATAMLGLENTDIKTNSRG